jgi:hypothetical protein
MRNPFRYFNSSPEVVRLTELLYVRCHLSPRQIENPLFERAPPAHTRSTAGTVLDGTSG